MDHNLSDTEQFSDYFVQNVFFPPSKTRSKSKIIPRTNSTDRHGKRNTGARDVVSSSHVNLIYIMHSFSCVFGCGANNNLYNVTVRLV